MAGWFTMRLNQVAEGSNNFPNEESEVENRLARALNQALD
jgi:hypothetical protein